MEDYEPHYKEVAWNIFQLAADPDEDDIQKVLNIRRYAQQILNPPINNEPIEVDE